MIEHKRLPLTLDSYEMEEVLAPLGKEGERITAIRVIVRGKNIIQRALEPEVRIGRSVLLYPQIQSDEQTIIGFLTTAPKDGAPIVLRYGGRIVARMAGPVRLRQLRRLGRARTGRALGRRG